MDRPPFFDLDALGDFIEGVFNTQKRAIPRAYEIGYIMRSLSKEGIDAVVDCNWDKVREIKNEILKYWKELGGVETPSVFREYMDFEVAQEIGEFFAVEIMFKIVLDNTIPPSLKGVSFDFYQMIDGITPQAILFSFIDAGSELSRCISRYIIKNIAVLNCKRRIEIRQRFLAIADEINGFLDNYNGFPPAVVDAYNKYGYSNTLRSKLNQIRGAIEYHTRLVEEALERLYP